MANPPRPRHAAPRRILVTLLSALCAAALPAAAESVLTLEIIEWPGGAPTEARLSVTGSDTLAYHPLPDTLCFFHPVMGGFFYAGGSAAVAVPEGMTRIIATKGPEYGAVDLRVNVQGDTTVTLGLERWIEPRDLGWIGGDNHADLTHSPAAYHIEADEAKLVARAEGLRVATFLDNGYLFTGGVGVLSDSTVTLFSSEEFRSPVYGHMGLLGIDSLLVPDYGSIGWPLLGSIVDRVRGHSHAIAVLAHPRTTDDFGDLAAWPGTGLGRGVWMEVTRGRIEALDVLSFSNHAEEGGAALPLWYDLWNAGYLVPGSAGTDGVVCRLDSRPIGGVRMYAAVGDPYASPADLYDAWIESLRRGRTYVTAGPLMTEFDVGGAGAGETLTVADGAPRDVTVHARFESSRRLDRIEVIRNGEVVETRDVGDLTTADIVTTVPVRETSWIAVRHDGYDGAIWLPVDRPLAHPTPVLVRLAGDDLTSAVSAVHARTAIDDLRSLLDTAATWHSAAESIAVAAALDDARTAWDLRSNAPPGPFHLLTPCPGCRITDTSPTFTWEIPSDADSTGPMTYRFVLATDPDFADVIIDTAGIPSASLTIPAVLDTDAPYWWRVRADDPAGGYRYAEEIDRWFMPTLPTAVEEGAGMLPVRLSATPNPFRGEVRFLMSRPLLHEATIALYNVAGRHVRALDVPPGAGEAVWDGRDESDRALPCGLYLYRFRSGDDSRTGRLFLVR